MPPASTLAPIVARPADAAATRADEPAGTPAQRHDHPLALKANRRDARAGDLQQAIECRADAHLRLLVGAGLDTASLRGARCASPHIAQPKKNRLAEPDPLPQPPRITHTNGRSAQKEGVSPWQERLPRLWSSSSLR